MKNKKAIIILTVFILLFLIGNVSANDINTIEASTSDTKEVTSIINVDLNDNNHIIKSNDVANDINTTEVIDSYTEDDVISTNEDVETTEINVSDNDSDLFDKSKLIDINVSKVSDYDLEKNLLSCNDDNSIYSLNSEILESNNNDILRDIAPTSASITTTDNSIIVTFNNLISTHDDDAVRLSYETINQNKKNIIVSSTYVRERIEGRYYYLYSGSYTIDVAPRLHTDISVTLDMFYSSSTSVGNFKSKISLTKHYDLDVVINDQTFDYNANGYNITGYASLNGVGITQTQYYNTYIALISKDMYASNWRFTTNIFSNGAFTITIAQDTRWVDVGSNIFYIFPCNHASCSYIGTFTITINKIKPTVAVSSTSINYNSGTYSVSGTCSANGLTINLKAGSTSLGSATVSNGKWTVSGISSTKLNPGSYTLTATSAETTSYGSGSATNTLTVSKSTPTVTVTDKNVNYNTGTYTLGGTVKVGSNNVGTGTVTIYKDGVQIGTASVSGGSWTSSTISSTSYDAGSYTITASYASNTYYNANSGNGTLTISKVTPTITVSTAPDIKYGNGVYTVSGTAKYGSNNVDMGTITLKCGDILLGTATVSAGLWTVSNIDTTLVDPSSSTYTITAYYESNVNYNGASAGNYLTVNKFTPDIIIESTLIWYNQSNGGVLNGKVYTYNGDFYSGFIDLYVNDELVASNVNVSSSGIWTYTLSSTTNLSPGTYSIGVVWKGNEYTNSNSATENKYTVSKSMVIPIITSTGNIDIGRTEYVYVDVNNVMGGGYLSGMTVTLQGSGIEGILQEISDVNGRATFIIPNLMAGKYDDWKIAVVSNDYYYPTMDSFNVGMFYVQYPLTVNITSISPNNSTYPEEIIVTGFTDADQIPQGNVSLTIGSKTYTAFFDSNGNFTASLIGVKPGVYNNITVKYNPTVDEFYYRGVESTVSIQETIINKYLPAVVFDSVNIDFGSYPGNATITGHITYVNNQIPTGRVEIIYNGKVYGNSTLNDAGEFIIAASNLPRGEYNLTIKYCGDDYYLNRTNTTSNIIINPSDVNFTITANNATYNVGETSTTIDVILTGLYGGDDIAKGIVRLEVGGKHWDAVLDNTGKATIEIKGLNAGDYTNAVLKYIVSNDERSYRNTTTYVDFSIYKADPGLGVRAPTIGAGKDGSIYITLNDNATGELILTVGTSVRVTLNITGGANRTYIINQPPVGANQVIATYNGDVNFNSSVAETMLYIERPSSYMNYTVTNITYGESEELEFKIYLDEELTKLASNATGTIRVYGLDKNYNVIVVGGLGYLSVPNLTKGNWTVIAIYSGNDELGGSDKDSKFTVAGVETPLSIIVNNNSINAGDDIIVTVTLNNTINDPVQLFVDNKLYYTNTTVNGRVSFVLRNLTQGNHNISALFNGNAGFESANNNTTVTVNRINVNPYINITYGRDILFNISVPDETTGYIKIKGNGTDESILIDNGGVVLILDNVTRGNYKFNIIYDGNWKYLPFNIEKTFTVNKVDDYILNITSTEAMFNKTVNITVTAFSDLEGKTINLTVDGTTKAINTVINGVATFNNVYIVSNTSGEFEIIASYAGDNIYGAKSFTTTVPIVPTDDYVLGLKALNIVHVGDNVLINITAPELITALNITINGKTQTISRNNFTFIMNDIDEGEYTVTISYAGDNAYKSKSNSTTFNVVKKDSSILIKVDNTHYGENAIINISVTDGATGYVLITIDNKTSKHDLIGSSIQIISNEYVQGLHNINVSYVGDRKYNPSNNVSSFTVFKSFDYNMTVYENGTFVGNNSILHKFVDHTLVVDVSLPDDAKGNLTFILYDNNHIKISNWTVTLPKNLFNYELRDVTNYTLEIIYSGDGNYESKLFKFEINVHKFLIDANATFIDNPYYVLSDSKINISSNLNNRQLHVYIDGVYYSLTDVITNNKTVFNLGKLSAGNHTISLMYDGDVNYTSLFTSHNITVSKLNSSVNITASSVRTGNPVIVNVNASGNGSANIIIFNGDGVLGSYNITINNGKGSFIVPIDFVAGIYYLDINYYGDDIYYESRNSTVFTVTDRIVSILNFNKPTFIVDVASVVNVSSNFPAGELLVYIDGVKQDDVVVVSGGKAKINLPGLSAGNHSILVSFAGDYDYTNLTTSFDIYVEKYNSTVNVSAGSVRTGNPVIVNVNASGNGNANIVILNGTDTLCSYNITINNGKGYLQIPYSFIEGSYYLDISYLGDDIYYGSNNGTVFTVTDRIVSVLNFSKPVFLVDVASVVNVSSNFPVGELLVYVDGVKQDDVVVVSGGKAKINLPSLNAGNHSILVSFAGDYDYTNLTTSFDIYVEKYNSTVNVFASSVRTGNPVIVNVNASGNGNANIVILNGTDTLCSYNITISNGKGYLQIPYSFIEGSYYLDISYLGDDIYYGSSNSTVFTVTDRVVSVLNFSKPVFLVDVASVVNVSSNFPAGELLVYVDGVKQDAVVVVSGGKAKINLPGLSAGNHSILVSFAGDYDYTNLTTSFDIYVEKYNSSVNVSASSVRTGNPVIVNVNASGNGTANIIIFDNNNIICEYNITINNGKGYLQVPYSFIEGNYNLNITYYGDNIYYESKNTTSFIVNDRINSTLNIDKFEFIVNTPDIITVSSNFPSGTVKVYIDGNEIDDISINNFEGKIYLNTLNVGNHTILLMYSGDYNHTNLTASFNIEVFKLNSTVNVSATNVRTGNNIIISINASGNGIANIIIYDESGIIGDYNTTIDGGKGSFIVPYTFAEGSYLVNVTYFGDDTYYGSFNVTDFVVSDKIFSTLKLDKQEVVANTPDVLVVSANFKSGTVNVYVDGVRKDDIYIVNNQSEIYLDALTPGEHNILLIYRGDYNYSSLTTSFTIIADRYNSTVKVTGDDRLIYNSSITFNITLNNTSTDAMVRDGFVVVTVYRADGSVAYTNSEVRFTNGAAQHVVSNLMAGDYYVIVNYPGNVNFVGNVSERFDFTIDKASTSVTANVNNLTFNDMVTVDYVIHNNDRTGAIISNEKVIIKIYNSTGNLVYSTDSASVTDMVGSFNISNYEFVAGKYTVNVTYDGDENFMGNSTLVTFEVFKARTAVSVNVNNTTFNRTVVVEYSLSNVNATNAHIPMGDVNVNIINKATGRTVYTNTSSFVGESGVLSITDFEFDSGNYSVTVTYAGNENFIGNSTQVDFTVFKARTAVSVNVNNSTFNQNIIIGYVISNINGTRANVPNGNVNISITDKATGRVVYRGSSSFTNEKGVLEIIDFEFGSGDYVVDVSYMGDANFLGNSSKFTFTVSKARSAVSVNVNNTTFNQNVIVEYGLSNANGTTAHIPDGNVIVSIINKANGRTIYTGSSSFVNEKGILKITDFEFGAGDYVVTVNYAGNANFTGNSTKFDFTVYKARSAVSVNVNNTTFNQNVIVEYGVTNINGTDANIPDSRVTINITNKASGRIVYSNKWASFSNEKGVLEITDFEFASGNYSVSVGYVGNANFTGNSTKFDFTVYKARSAVSVNVNNITFNQRVGIAFNLSNVNGTSAHIPNSKVTISIINKDTGDSVYSRDVSFADEKGALEIIDFEFASGNYTVNVTYGGNENFIGSSISSNFSVSKARSAVSVNVNNITFNQNVVIGYNLSNINGTNARIPNSEVNINIINKESGLSVYNVNSSFIGEKGVLRISDFEFNAGNYSVTVTYAGNENFVGNSTEFDFTVYKAHTNVYVKVNSTTFNQTIIVEYALSNIDGTIAHIPDSTVTISVSDKNTGSVVYTNVSSFVGEKGVLRISDFEFTGGNYSVTVAYAGNENFIGNSTKSDFTVLKARTSVSAIINNTIFNQDVVIKYTLSNVNGTDAHIPDSQVTINIVNRETGQIVYSKQSSFNNEEGILNMIDFDFIAGSYMANITYVGNANFEGNSIIVPFTVSKAHTNVSVNVNDTTFNQNIVVEYNLENIDGTAANIPNGNVMINITRANNPKVIYSSDASFVNGKGVLNISDYAFAAGNYTVTVTYKGNENFTGNSTKFNFTVSKANTNIWANANDTIFNQTVVIEYNLSNVNGTSAHIPNGRVSITIIDKETGLIVYSNGRLLFVDESGVFSITDFEFSAGEYRANVSYAGNANFTDCSTLFDFTVYKAHTQVYANVNDTTFNQNVVIEYNLENADGTNARIPNSDVTITIKDMSGNQIYNTTAFFNREKGVLRINDFEFDVGEYTVEVTYDGNDNFEGNSTLRNFRVSKAHTAVSVNVNNVTFDQNIVVDYSLRNVNGTSAHIPDGTVVVSIIDKTTGRVVYENVSSFVNERGMLTTTNSRFVSGNYTANVTYGGSDNFLDNYSLFDFTVYKAHTRVSVNVNNTIFNNTVAVEYKLDNIDTSAIIPNANVAVNIINKSNNKVVYTSTSSFVDEKGILYINDFELSAGDYTANVTYNGSDNFIGSSYVYDFRISKAHTSIISNASNVIYNSDVMFNVDVVNTDTGAVLDKSLELVSVDIIGDNGYSYHNVSSVNDANEVFTNLGAGRYSVTVKYNGNSNFLASNDVIFNFVVSRASTRSVVSADNVAYDARVTVHGDVYNQDTSAAINEYDKVNVSVYSNGNVVYSANVSVGDLRSGHILPLLNAGAYTVTVRYYNSENFTESRASANFNVSKANSMIQFNDDYVVMGNNLSFTVVNITDGSTITLKVNNRIYTGSVVNGVGYILVNSGDSGIFDNVLVSFAGDTDYNPSNSTGTVKFIRPDSFTALQLLIDENTDGNLIFNNNFAFDSNTDDVNGVNVNKSINIDGNGYAIDASGASSMFNVTGDDVNIRDVAIYNVAVSDNGSVIIWSGDDGSINNVTFANNSIGNGNVINVDADNLIISNSNFTNNSGINGDIISINDVENTIISNSVFDDNHLANGSVIDIVGSDGTGISDSIFANNILSDGVVIGLVDCADTNIDNTSFTGNVLDSNSIAVDIFGSNNTNIEECNFTDNIVSGNSTVLNIDNAKSVNLTNVNFINDNASDNSSVVIITVSDDVNLDNVNVDLCNVDGDNSIMMIDDSNATISNSLMTNNTADKGNVIVIDLGSEVYIENVATLNNVNNNKHRDITYETLVEINSSDIHVGDDAIVNVKVITSYPYDVNGILIIMSNGDNYYFSLTSDKGSFSISGLKEGIYNISGIYAGNKYIDETVSNTVTINVSKVGDFNFTVSNTVINTSDSLVMNLPADASGNVSVTIGNESFVVPVVNGKALIDGDKLPLGFNNLNASYSGDDKYTSKVLADVISVKCDKYDIVIENGDLAYGDDLVILLPENATGNVDVIVGNKSFNVPINKSKAIINGYDLPLGYSDIIVSYDGNDKYVSGNLSETVNVRLGNYTWDVDSDVIVAGDDLVVNLPADASGDVIVVIGDVTFVVPVVDGKANIPTDNIPLGDYNASISYSGDNKYVPKENIANISIVSGIVVTAPDVVKYYAGPERFIVNVADIKGRGIANKTVTVTLNNINYTRVTNEYGNVSFAVNLPSGEYLALINVDDMFYNASIIVNPTIIGNDFVKVYKNDSQYYVTVYGFDGNYLPQGSLVVFNINGVFYNRFADNEGRVKLNINLLPGTYIITSNNTVTGEVCANNVTVISKIINNYDVVKYFRNGTHYYVTLVDDYGNVVGAGVSVTFNINGVFYTCYTNASGVAKLNINLPEGEYIITADYDGCYASNKIVVLPILTGNDLVKSYGSRDQFVVNVFDGRGNPCPNQQVTFNINGVFYTRVSDADGRVVLNINLPVGEYIITSSYNGTSISNKVTVTE